MATQMALFEVDGVDSVETLECDCAGCWNGGECWERGGVDIHAEYERLANIPDPDGFADLAAAQAAYARDLAAMDIPVDSSGKALYGVFDVDETDAPAVDEIRRYSCGICEADPRRCYQKNAHLPPIDDIGLIIIDCACLDPRCADCVIPGPGVRCWDCGMPMARTPMAVMRRRCWECYAAVMRGGRRGAAARDLTREAQERQMRGGASDYAQTTAEALGVYG